jgi:hypothetical protein
VNVKKRGKYEAILSFTIGFFVQAFLASPYRIFRALFSKVVNKKAFVYKKLTTMQRPM